jgi:hypothetical protein
VQGKRPSGRPWFILASLLTAAFGLNVALRMLEVKRGMSVWNVGDVGEFLLVLLAMVFFVFGLLCIEERPKSPVLSTHNDAKGGSQ